MAGVCYKGRADYVPGMHAHKVISGFPLKSYPLSKACSLLLAALGMELNLGTYCATSPSTFILRPRLPKLPQLPLKL